MSRNMNKEIEVIKVNQMEIMNLKNIINKITEIEADGWAPY